MLDFGLEFQNTFGIDGNINQMLEEMVSDDSKRDGTVKEDEGGTPLDGRKSDITDKVDEAVIASCALMDLASSDEIQSLAESTEDMQDVSEMFGIAMERTIVRLDRNDRMKHLRKANVLALARKDNHIKYRKLLTLWQMERTLEKDLESIYHTKADQLARKQIQNYAANGIKKIPKAYPSTTVGKKSISGHVATRAKSQADRMFNKPKLKVGAR